MQSRREFLRDCGKYGIGFLSLVYGLDELYPRESEALGFFDDSIVVDLGKIELNFLKWDKLSGNFIIQYRYPAVIGTREHPTPVGDFKIHEIVYKPDWVVPKENGEYMEWVKDFQRKVADEHDGIIPYGHWANPLGECKIRLNYYDTNEVTDVLIHGNGDRHIRKRYSAGCIRLRNRDILELSKNLYKDFPVFTRNRFRLDDFLPVNI